MPFLLAPFLFSPLTPVFECGILPLQRLLKGLQVNPQSKIFKYRVESRQGHERDFHIEFFSSAIDEAIYWAGLLAKGPGTLCRTIVVDRETGNAIWNSVSA